MAGLVPAIPFIWYDYSLSEIAGINPAMTLHPRTHQQRICG
jgi:hypothetical protein